MFLVNSSMMEGDKDGLKIGKKAPLFTEKMNGIDGSSLSLSEIKKNKGLIVIFSCNTCPFVVGNDDFEGWEKQYNEINKVASCKGIGMVLINSNEAKRNGDDSIDEMTAHSRDNEYTMPYLVDQNSALANAFGAKTTPHAFVFDSNNKLIYKGSIDNSWDSKRVNLERYLHNAIDQIAGGVAIKENVTPPRGCSIKRVK